MAEEIEELEELDEDLDEEILELIEEEGLTEEEAEEILEEAEFIGERVGNLVGVSMAALAAVILRGWREGKDAEEIADNVEDTFGLTEPLAQAVVTYRAGLEELGTNEDSIDNLVDRYTNRALLGRAEGLSRTEVMEALNDGVREEWEDRKDRGEIEDSLVMEWIVTPDDRLCPLCEALEGETAEIGEDFSEEGPPRHPNCFPAGVMVESIGKVIASSERWYEGNLVVLRTAAGNELSCTPNHPILADRGWVPAGALDVGCYVISHRRVERMPSAVDDHQHVPTRIEEMARSLDVVLVSSPTSAEPVSAEGFDYYRSGDQVGTIRANRELIERFHTSATEQGGELSFGWIGLDGKLTRLSPANQTFMRILGTSSSRVCAAHLSRSLFGGHTAPLDGLALTLVTQGNLALFQAPIDAAPRDVIPFGESQYGFAGGVQLDKLIEIDVVPFRGHVFNLQTESEMLVSNSIITHNCRCTVGLVERE